MKYTTVVSLVYRDGMYFAKGADKNHAAEFAAELNTLLARAEAAEKRAEQAERDRDVLGQYVKNELGWGEFVAIEGEQLRSALSRCTPPASKEATNG